MMSVRKWRTYDLQLLLILILPVQRQFVPKSVDVRLKSSIATKIL